MYQSISLGHKYVKPEMHLAAKELARQRGTTLGAVLSDLARQALTQQEAAETRGGLPLLPVQPDAGVAKLELVNRLRDEAV